MEIKKFIKILLRSIKLHKRVMIVGSSFVLDNLKKAIKDFTYDENLNIIKEKVFFNETNTMGFADRFRGREYGCVISICYQGITPTELIEAVNIAVNNICFGRNSENCTSVFNIKINL